MKIFNSCTKGEDEWSVDVYRRGNDAGENDTEADVVKKF